MRVDQWSRYALAFISEKASKGDTGPPYSAMFGVVDIDCKEEGPEKGGQVPEKHPALKKERKCSVG